MPDRGMRWSNDLPPRYFLHFGWREGQPEGDGKVRGLIADSLEDAKLEAAILYACADLTKLPTAYCIVKGARRVVYRYPEGAARTD
jgi:hypothetical protein